MMKRFPWEKLEHFCTELLTGAGVPETDARIVSGVLVSTSLDGVDTHGISRLPVYLSCLQKGRINAQAKIGVEHKTPSVAIVDGDNGLGQLVGVRAMEVAIGKAQENGIAAVGVRHSNHYGASSYYCKMAARKNMIGLAYTNAPQAIPPWGGKKPYFGTNPIAFGFPASGTPVVVDMSSSMVARGNIILAAREGRSIPEGWAIDSEGRPTKDPNEALKGAVLPVGGAKGYALAMAVEVMAGVLSGSMFGTQVGFIYDDKLTPAGVGHFFIVLDVQKFMPVDDFLNRMKQMVDEVKAVPRADGVQEIFVPGERRELQAEKRRKEGVPISGNLLADLNKFAHQTGIEPLV